MKCLATAHRVNDGRRSLWGFMTLTCLLSWPIWFASGVLSRGGFGPYDLRWLVALLLHTSINVMGDLGLSSFEAASVVFCVVESAAALIVVATSPLFRETSRH